MNKWIDISQTLSNDMAHWPGDQPFHFDLAMTKEESGSVNIGNISTSAHTGTHVDAPFHFDEDGNTIEELDVNIYIGQAKVIDLTEEDKITVEALEKHDFTGSKRLLIKTRKSINEKQFPEEYMVVDEAVGAYLHTCGVRLLGTESPSVDSVSSKELLAHHALHEHGVFILENIVLTDVEQGMYDLIALPLKIKGADGSPVRAVIRKRA